MNANEITQEPVKNIPADVRRWLMKEAASISEGLMIAPETVFNELQDMTRRIAPHMLR